MKAVPPVNPFTAVPASSTASIAAAATVTVTVALSQLVGLSISQILYTKEYEPAGVPAATITLVPESVIPALVAETKVVLT